MNEKGLVIYDQRVRWVAALNLAFAGVGIWLGIQFLEGFNLYLLVGFLALYSLFWVRGVIFGFRIKLVSDGVTLQWQENKQAGSVRLGDIRKVLIGTETFQQGETTLGFTYVRFQTTSGNVEELPPNTASGLRARKWRKLKQLIAHIRTVSNVAVEPINEGKVKAVEAWEEPPYGRG